MEDGGRGGAVEVAVEEGTVAMTPPFLSLTPPPIFSSSLCLFSLHSCRTPHMELLLVFLFVGLAELFRLSQVTLAGCA